MYIIPTFPSYVLNLNVYTEVEGRVETHIHTLICPHKIAFVKINKKARTLERPYKQTITLKIYYLIKDISHCLIKPMRVEIK